MMKPGPAQERLPHDDWRNNAHFWATLTAQSELDDDEFWVVDQSSLWTLLAENDPVEP